VAKWQLWMAKAVAERALCAPKILHVLVCFLILRFAPQGFLKRYTGSGAERPGAAIVESA